MVCYSLPPEGSASGSSRFRNDPITEPLCLTLEQERTRQLAADNLAAEPNKGDPLLSTANRPRLPIESTLSDRIAPGKLFGAPNYL